MNKTYKSIVAGIMMMGISIPSLAQVSLSDKVGQMLMVGFTNFTSAKDTLINDIQDRNLGGILYFGYNIQSPGQIKALNHELQGYATTPLLLSTDQEGGRVARLSSANGYQSTNSAQRTGIVWASVDSTRAQAKRMAGWFDEAIVKVINSGTDILLFNNNRCTVSAPCGSDTQNSLSRYVIDLVLRKVEEGAISEYRIDESYNRIIALKERRIVTDIKFAELPQTTVLHQNYPNPFNPTTSIRFELSDNSPIRLSVYDILGREMIALVNGQYTAGSHIVTFDATNLASGVYIYRLETGHSVLNKKMTLVK